MYALYDHSWFTITKALPTCLCGNKPCRYPSIYIRFFFLNFSLRWQLCAHKEDSFGSPSCHIEYVTSNGTASASCTHPRCRLSDKIEARVCVTPVILSSHLATILTKQRFRCKLDSSRNDWLCTMCSLDLFLKLNLSSGFDPSSSDNRPAAKFIRRRVIKRVLSVRLYNFTTLRISSSRSDMGIFLIE